MKFVTKSLLVQQLRALAVIAVVVFHSFPQFRFGYLGVDLFFLISGYVISPAILSIFKDQDRQVIANSFFLFLKKRFWRLLPALYACTLIVGIMTYFFFDPHDFRRIGLQTIFTYLFIGNIGAQRYAGDYFNPNLIPLIHTWSLSAEIQIFIGIPLLISLSFLLFRRIWILSILSFIFLVSLVSFLGIFNGMEIQRKIPGSSFIFNYYSPLMHVWQFISGTFLFLVMNKKSVVKNSLIFYFGLSVLFLILFSNWSLLSTSLNTIILISVSLIVISFGVPVRSFLGRILVWIGDRSYSIYLFHLPFLFLMNDSPLFAKRFDSILGILIGISLTLIVSQIVYKLIENPFKSGFHGISRQTQVVSIVGMIMSLAIPITLISYPTSGLIYTQSPYYLNSPFVDNAHCRKSSIELLCSSIEKTKSKKILLIGDSHARVLLNPFLDYQKSNNDFSANYSSSDGCFFFKPTLLSFTKKIGEGSAPCAEHNRLVFDWISQNNPDLVIIATRSSIRSSIHTYFTSRAHFHRVQAASLDRLLEAFTGKIIIVTPNPDFSQRAVFQQLLGGQVDFDRTDLLDRNWAEKYSLDSKGRVSIVDSTQVICGLNECQRSALMKLYFDNNHLNLHGAEKVFAAIKKNPNFQSITS